jgi:hypothetical protein
MLEKRRKCPDKWVRSSYICTYCTVGQLQPWAATVCLSAKAITSGAATAITSGAATASASGEQQQQPEG